MVIVGTQHATLQDFAAWNWQVLQNRPVDARGYDWYRQSHYWLALSLATSGRKLTAAHSLE